MRAQQVAILRGRGRKSGTTTATWLSRPIIGGQPPSIWFSTDCGVEHVGAWAEDGIDAGFAQEGVVCSG